MQLPATPLRWFVVSVNRTIEAQFSAWIRVHRPADTYTLLQYQHFPLEIDVRAPERVGTDRLAAAVAANELRTPQRSAIVVDAGTAVTVDLMTSDGVFRGGAILPGIQTAAQGLASATDALPLLENLDLSSVPAPIGKSTQDAMRSGIVWGCVGAVRELIAQMSAGLSHVPNVFCTGGDGMHLARLIDRDMKFDPNLVLRGIALTGFRHSTRSVGVLNSAGSPKGGEIVSDRLPPSECHSGTSATCRAAVLTPRGRGAVATVIVEVPRPPRSCNGCSSPRRDSRSPSIRATASCSGTGSRRPVADAIRLPWRRAGGLPADSDLDRDPLPRRHGDGGPDPGIPRRWPVARRCRPPSGRWSVRRTGWSAKRDWQWPKPARCVWRASCSTSIAERCRTPCRRAIRADISRTILGRTTLAPRLVGLVDVWPAADPTLENRVGRTSQCRQEQPPQCTVRLPAIVGASVRRARPGTS